MSGRKGVQIDLLLQMKMSLCFVEIKRKREIGREIVGELAEKTGSRYQLVNMVARRARQISEEAEEKQIPLDRKPVSSAIDEVYTGKLSIK